MLSLLVIAAACAGWRYIPPLLAGVIATLVALVLLDASRRAREALVTAGSVRQGHPASWDRQPTRHELRLLRRSLRATMRSTAFISLLPAVAARAHRLMR